MDISALTHRLVLLFFTLAAGFVAARCGVLGKKSNATLSSLIVNVTNPMQILSSVMVSERLLTNGQVLELTAINVGLYVLLSLAGLGLVRLLRVPEKDRRTFRFMLIFSNTGFLGYPLAEALLGQSARFCISIFVLCFQLYVWTYGAFLMEGGEKFRPSWAMFRRPCVVAALAAYVLYFTGLRFPDIVGEALNYVGALTGPLAMLIVGTSLAMLDGKTVFGNWRMYVLCAVKLLVIPTAVWAALHGVLGEGLMLEVLILSWCMPVATNTTIFCYQFGREEECASSGVFLSTLMSVVTIPLVLKVLF